MSDINWMQEVGLLDLSNSGGTATAAIESPLADVSYSSEAMQTSTPTGNGSGVFMDSSWADGLMGGLNKVLDYAIKKDAYQMGQQVNLGLGATAPQQIAQRRQNNLMFLMLCGVGVYMLVSGESK